jgi:SnoaL-like domain
LFVQDNAIGGAAITSSRSSKRDAPGLSLVEVTGAVGIPADWADLPPLRYYAEYGRRYASRDLDAFIELFDPEWKMTDHRVGGFESPIGRETCRALTASVFAVSPDVRFTIDEVLACDERVVAMRASYHGSGIGGHGRFAFEGGVVTVVEGGHSITVDHYEYEDNEAMLARYAELTHSR